MDLSPPNYRNASAGRRAFATAINVLCIGGLTIPAQGAGLLAPVEGKEIVVRVTLMALIVCFWLLSGLVRSPGAMFAMIELGSPDRIRLSRAERLRRSSPYLVFGLVVYLPAYVFPFPATEIQSLLTILGLLGAAVDGISVYLGGPSLLDRIFRTSIFQLSLPKGMMPRVLGMRIW